MRIAIIGAGLAGLATAAAFSRAGHDVQVFEQTGGLRATGLVISLWPNATSLLPRPWHSGRPYPRGAVLPDG